MAPPIPRSSGDHPPWLIRRPSRIVAAVIVAVVAYLATGRLLAHGEYTFGADPFAYTTEQVYWANHAWLYDLGLYRLYLLAGGTGLVIAKALLIAVLAWLQIAGYRAADNLFRRKSVGSIVLGQAASWGLLIGSALVALRDDWSGLAWFPPGAILAFGFAGAISWVLLIEINR